MGYKKEIKIHASIEKVWNSWTNEEETSNWLAPKSHIVFEDGGPYEFFWDDNPEKDSTIGCKLLRVEKRKILCFEWQGKSEFLEMFKKPYGKTIIEVNFIEEENGIMVEVKQEETRNLEKWIEYDEWMSGAWEYALSCLKKYCEASKDEKEDKLDCC
ncbi:MAG: SRPBCC domain-containing protein [Candidatus Marinimicrobia bacterium]|nr:SRPBCC domain-containing protein [Candidatus Neomarinimicrobiota bacterium]